MSEYDFAADLLDRKKKREASEAPEPTGQVDFAKELTGTKSAIAPRPSRDGFAPMREFLPRAAISEPSLAAPPGVAFEAGVPTDQARAIQIFAQRRGIDPSRYRVIDGEIAFRGDDGQFYKEVAGLKSTAAFYTPDVLAAIPEIAVGGLTAPMMVSGPLGVAASAGLTGLTAGAVEAGRQAISGQEMNLPRVGTAAGLSGLLQNVILSGFDVGLSCSDCVS